MKDEIVVDTTRFSGVEHQLRPTTCIYLILPRLQPGVECRFEIAEPF